MPYVEKEITKQYFPIGDVARELNIAPSAIRFWEGEFDRLASGHERRGIRPKMINGHGNRRYTLEEIQRVIDMHQLVTGVHHRFKSWLIGCGLTVPSAVLNYPKREEIIKLFDRRRIMATVQRDKLKLEIYG